MTEHETTRSLVRFGQVNARSIGDGPPVQAVEGQGVEVLVHEAVAADVGDQADVETAQAHSFESLVQFPGKAVA